MDASRLEREREYHNQYFESGDRSQTEKFYHVFGASTEYFEQRMFEHAGPGKRVLEYGCGDGDWSYAYELAARGAEVTGIDLSDVAIRIAAEKGAKQGLSERLTFKVMNAEALEFPDNSFDLICGNAILHHLDLERSYAELARTLKPGGATVFSEPLGHNPAINLYRKRTPALRTADEHPLKMQDLALARRYFGRVEMRAFYLLALFGVPLRNMKGYPTLRRVLSGADKALFAVLPFLRRYAWISIVVLSEPKK